MDSNARKKKSKIYERSENVIPDYEFLFKDEVEKSGKSPKILRKLAKGNRKNFLGYFFSEIGKTLPVWIVPLLTAEIINMAGQSFSNTMLWKLLIYAVIIVLLYLLNVPMTIWHNRIADTMIRQTGAGLKKMVVRKLQKLSITYHKEMETGKIQSKFLKDMEAIDNFNRNMLYSFIPAIMGVIIAIGITLYRSWWVTLFFIVIIPVNVLVTLFFQKRLRRNSHALRVESENLSAKLTTMLEMIPVTKAHGLENKELDTLDVNIKRVTKKGLDADHATAVFGSWVWVINCIFSAICLVFCVYMCMIGVISVGEIVLFQSMFSSINNSILGIINCLPTVVSGVESLNSVSEIMLSTEIESNVSGGKVDINGAIRFDNVSYKYPNAKDYVIKNFSLDVKEGECIAVVGASGSGKSTIMNLIIGFLKPTDGMLYVDDKPIVDMPLSEYRKNISVVPQNSILFSGSIKENITYGLNEYTEEELNRVVEMANVTEFVKELPNGINSDVGEHGGKLSGGQKQRITIARALIRNPKILILDEATSALDNISEYHVQRAIASLIKGRTTFIVAHRLSTIRDADRIVVMNEGECVEVGTYEELIEKRGKFYELKTLNDLNYKQAEEALS